MKRRNRARRLVIPSALLLAALAFATARPARASDIGSGRPFGLGIILGDPTGLSGKWFINPDHAIDFAVGAGWFGGHSLRIHADYLFHFHLASTSAFDLPLYIGVGPTFAFWYGDTRYSYWGATYDGGRFGVGVRVPIGVSFQFNEVPLDLFLELAPAIGFLPGIGAFLDGGIGLRYWF